MRRERHPALNSEQNRLKFLKKLRDMFQGVVAWLRVCTFIHKLFPSWEQKCFHKISHWPRSLHICENGLLTLRTTNWKRHTCDLDWVVLLSANPANIQ
jgi:hypothetical protein